MSIPNPTPLLLSLAPQIAAYSLQVPNHPEIEIAQAAHRIHLINNWAIPRGARVLELGCGQGNATAVLAEAVGESGHIDAVDPGSPDYGAPFTLSQAQSHLSSGPVGGRITWHRGTPQEFLRQTSTSNDSSWDVAVLSHCIWYFSSPDILTEILTSLHGWVHQIHIAEYALHATQPSSFPHVLAILARGTLESQKDSSTENVRTPLTPSAIKQISHKCHWECVRESNLVPDPGLQDGSWEVGSVMSEDFASEVDKFVANERLRTVILSARDAVGAAVTALEGGKVGTMDVWVASFSPLTL